MRNKEKVKDSLGKFYTGGVANKYDYARVNDIRQRDALDREAEIIKEYLQGSNKGDILDVACGTGIMFKHYGNRKIYGVDISEDMLKIAKNKFPNAQLSKADAEKLPFPDNKFSVVITSKFICHIPNYKKVISEMVRVTKPGGTIIIDFFNRDSLTFPTTKIRLMTGTLRHFNLFSYKDIRKIARENNLEIKKLRSKVFIPLKVFPKFAHKLANKINTKFADVFPKYSSPIYVKFIKKK